MGKLAMIMVSRKGTATIIILLASTLLVAGAFSHPMVPRPSCCRSSSLEHISYIFQKSDSGPFAVLHRHYPLASLRGGATEGADDSESQTATDPSVGLDKSATLDQDPPQPQRPQRIALEVTKTRKSGELLATAAAFPMGALSILGSTYSSFLLRRPILTKSATACVIFALSDCMAQRLEKRDDRAKSGSKTTLVWSRILASAAVGFFYFGPAAHYWYDMIFRILPGTSLVSTIQKAALGQLFFGPTFTCIFFATGLMQLGQFSLPNWWRKVRSDLPGAWLAGVGFWPLVDLVSFSLIQPQFIPLFVNLCSLVWTTYLVLKSYN